MDSTSRKLKILDLPNWVPWTYQRSPEDMCGLAKIIPRVGRDGHYFDRQTREVWFEYRGSAWIDKRTDDFEYALAILNHRPLSERERFAIMELKRLNRCPKSLVALLYTDKNWQDLREIDRGTRGARRTVVFKRRILELRRAKQSDPPPPIGTDDQV